MKQEKILVTGGAGFIGGNFIHNFIRTNPDYHIFNLDLLTYAGELQKHRHLENDRNYTFIQMDITNFDAITELFQREKFDYVIHFAAETHVDRAIINSETFIKTNVLGTQNLLEASKEIGVKKFVHISTDEVYGDLAYDSTEKFSEISPVQPNNTYSASKASADLIVQAYYKTYGLPMNIVRFSNNYGPYQFPEKLIPLTIIRLLNDEKVPIYGDGKNIRDWLYVKDASRAVVIVLHKGIPGEIYNVSANNEKRNIDVVRTILQELGKTESSIEYVKDRPGHDRKYVMDSSKIKSLGWRPNTSFEQGIKQTIAWYRENKIWWSPLLKGELNDFFQRHYTNLKKSDGNFTSKG
ncbi:dTDP-glucose 4,6-dehydratase [Fervidibacillus halotolerans]|uniref:dTDP-glucose 4,6-dehydratase n=1 Tax=Fervidibacillus halotolerans TaxID=2980027 RepID=A0A9E8M3N5_9BACI|nr:dTDP-glucose 4,6-dehydratase [Fervidibacillus halotolerans]WAA13976.1 dTDP-glucose 4,6-dehydratase [Fervidibacillus halotolerans]